MIISHAKLSIPSTFWLKWIFTELFDTTRGFWNQACTLIPLFSKLLILQEYVKKESSGYFTSEAFGLYHFLDIVDIYGVIWYNYVIFESWPVHFSQYLRNHYPHKNK